MRLIDLHHRPPISPHIVRKIAEYRAQGLGARAISEMPGMPARTTVQKYIKISEANGDLDKVKYGTKTPQAIRDKIIELYNTGLCANQIYTMDGMPSETTVRNIISVYEGNPARKKLGMAKRPKLNVEVAGVCPVSKGLIYRVWGDEHEHRVPAAIVALSDWRFDIEKEQPWGKSHDLEIAAGILPEPESNAQAEESCDADR